MELVWKYGRLSSISFLKSSIPFHSGIFHIPYEIPVPFHSIPCTGNKWPRVGNLWATVTLVAVRGGVEDTRLEAKSKDTKKIRGQGQEQPFRGQTLSRPRTGMLEAKAKDQGHKRKCSPKKKKKRSSQKFFRRSQKKKRSSQKFFKRSPQKYVFQKIFQALHKILTIQKILLSSSWGQANFRRLEASRPRPRTWPSRPRPARTSKSVLEDSTSGSSITFIARRFKIIFFGAKIGQWRTQGGGFRG